MPLQILAQGIQDGCTSGSWSRYARSRGFGPRADWYRDLRTQPKTLRPVPGQQGERQNASPSIRKTLAGTFCIMQ